MKYEYHTIFLSAIQAEAKKYMKTNEFVVDGIEFARDIQNTIHKMSENEYELFQTIPIISTQYLQRTYTEGVTLIFRKELDNGV